jgi:multiple sugar transport system substrate-binding protein
MNERMSRRAFLKRGTGTVAAAAFGGTLISAVAGCGSGSSAGSSRSSGGTLTVYADANPQGQGLQPLIPEFEKQTGIKVSYQVISELEITNKAAVALAAGNGTVDVTWGGISEKPAWVTAGWVEPIDDYLADTSLVGKDYSTSDWLPACWQATEQGGKHYGFPTLLDTNILMYRKDILSGAGVTVPRTVSDLLAACGKVNKKPVPAIALRGARGVHSNIWIFNIFYYGEGGIYYKGQKPGGPAPSGRLSAAMDTAADLTGLQTYGEFFRRGYTPAGSASWDYPETTAAFKGGKAAMLVDDIAFALEMIDALGDKVGFAPAPRGPAGVFPGFDTQMWFLAKGTPNKEAAIKFMAWSTSPEIQVRAAKNGKYIGVTRQSALHSSAFRSFARPDVLDVLDKETPDLDINHFVQTPSFNVVGDYMSIAVNEVISGTASARSALSTAQSQAASYLLTHSG